LRFIFTIGTAGKSGGTDVLLDMMTFTGEMGIQWTSLPLDNNTGDNWRARYPHVPQIGEWEVKPDDILIVSEEFIWAAAHLSKYTNKYIMLNQGLFASLVSDFKRNTYSVTKTLYHGSMGVIANSVHTKVNVAKLFDLNPSKVHINSVRIDEIFKPGIKENIVSFMPRKNRAFGCFVVNYLSGIFLDYEFVPIDNMAKPEIADILGRSKIFLSFGGPEGFGMPPVEAAFAGCKVIGFDGIGGEEYFHPPIFKKIPFYDHMAFINYTEEYMSDPTNDTKYQEDRNDHMNRLKETYSIDSARQSWYNAIDNILGASK